MVGEASEVSQRRQPWADGLSKIVAAWALRDSMLSLALISVEVEPETGVERTRLVEMMVRNIMKMQRTMVLKSILKVW